MSHTVTVTIEFRDREALARACSQVRAKMGSQGQHKLYASTHSGLSVNLAGWQYPIVISDAGQVHFDNFNGRWGNPAELEKLTQAYAIEVSRSVAEAAGMITELQADGSLLVYHPDGGTLTIGQGGDIDASGFTGQNCAAATQAFETALGTTTVRSCKPEYNQIHQPINEQES